MGSRFLPLAITVTMLAAGTACSKATDPEREGGQPKAGTTPAATTEKYPEPRWPSYFKRSNNVEDLMPAARSLVRNTSGFQGKGMGILQEGEEVLIVATASADPMVLEAIQRALVERKVKPHIKFSYEFTGESKDLVQKRQAANQRNRDNTKAGIYQATSWINGQFPDPEVPKKWLKERRPDLYAELFPNDTGAKAKADEDPETGLPRANPRDREIVGLGIQKFLKENPKCRGVFWGGGGTTGLRRALYPMQDQYLGTFITDNVYTLQSQMTTYPGDVWQLAEEQILEPLVYADRLEITDPEGTNLWADITPDMAERWSQGAYQRGHLYMFPNQATGRFGYSFVNYPGFQQKWLPREPIALINGVLAGTQGHGGFFPRWEVTFKDGFIADVKGGGAQGAALKEFLQYPGLNDTDFPVPHEAGVLVSLRDRIRLAPEGLPSPAFRSKSLATPALSGRAAASSTGASASGSGTIRMRRRSRRSGRSSRSRTTRPSITAGTRTPTSRPTRSACATPTSGSRCSTRAG